MSLPLEPSAVFLSLAKGGFWGAVSKAWSHFAALVRKKNTKKEKPALVS